MRKLIIVGLIGLFALISYLLTISLQRDPSDRSIQTAERLVPEFNQPSLEDSNRMLTRRDLPKDYFLLHVWASWCTICRAEHAFLQTLSKEIAIVGINYKDSHKAAIDYLNEAGTPYLFNISDPDGHFTHELGVYATPETYIVSPKGTIIYRHLGALTPELWEKQLLPKIKNGGNP